MALIYLIFMTFLFYWQANAVKASKTSKARAIGLYAIYAAAPIILYGAVFMALVGIEELSGKALVGEGYARSLLLVIGGGLVVTAATTLLFSLLMLMMKPRDVDPN